MSSIHGYRRTAAEWKAMFDDEDVQVDMRQMLADYTELEHDLGIWKLRAAQVEKDRDSWKFAAQDCSKQWRNDIAELDHLREELTHVWSNERHQAEMADLRGKLKDLEDYYEYAKLGAWHERDAARDRIEERKRT